MESVFNTDILVAFWTCHFEDRDGITVNWEDRATLKVLLSAVEENKISRSLVNRYPLEEICILT